MTVTRCVRETMCLNTFKANIITHVYYTNSAHYNMFISLRSFNEFKHDIILGFKYLYQYLLNK